MEEVGGEVEDMREELVKAVAGADRKARGKNGDALPSPSTFDPDDDNYAAFEQQRQEEMMHEQDEALDDVFQTVGNLRQQADDMGRELGEQGELLEDVDGLADRVGGRLQDGIKKIGTVVKKNEGERHVLVLTHVLTNYTRYPIELLHRAADIRPHPASDLGPYLVDNRPASESKVWIQAKTMRSSSHLDTFAP